MNPATKNERATKIATDGTWIRATDVATYHLPTRDAAWEFMAACDAAGISAGYPSLRSPVGSTTRTVRTVQVGLATQMDREKADALAASFNGGQPAVVTDYAFAGSIETRPPTVGTPRFFIP